MAFLKPIWGFVSLCARVLGVILAIVSVCILSLRQIFYLIVLAGDSGIYGAYNPLPNNETVHIASESTINAVRPGVFAKDRMA